MENKILLAVDDSKNALNAVEYVAKSAKLTSTVTLFSVLPGILAPVREMERAYMKPETFVPMEQEMQSAVEAFMEEAKKALLNAGFTSENIHVTVRKKKVGVARDILEEAEQGQYDTIVIGRRGLSAVKQFVFGSVSNKVVHLAKNVAVIVVD
jgi:nucleotide-binding universal stress UspA family protein